MVKAYFVTGTDTEVGKTFVSCRLLEAAERKGLSTLGLKPVAAGCEMLDGELKNEDAIALQSASTIKLPYGQVNPIALPDACSPHIAAARAKKSILASRLVGYCRGALMKKPEFALVEGAGGWYVPISPRETIATLAKQLELPVILVVDMKLGCINHALLSAQAIRSDGLVIAGWVANQVSAEQMAFYQENLDTLKSALGAPFIGALPRFDPSNDDNLRGNLDIDCLTV